MQDKYQGNVPHNREALENLPGVGRKTANVVLNVWFGEAALAVDTHVMRISRRLELSNGKTPLEIEKDLLKVLPDNYIKNANHWLVLFGRYICKAQKTGLRPNCPGLPLYATRQTKEFNSLLKYAGCFQEGCPNCLLQKQYRIPAQQTPAPR